MDTIRAKVILHMPEKLWLAKVSKQHNGTTFYLLSFLPTKELIGNTLVKIEGGDINIVLKEIKKHPSLVELNLLERTENSAVINTKTKDPWLLSAMMKSEVILKPPVKVKEGTAEWVVLSTRKKLSALVKMLDEKGVEYRIKSIDKYHEEPVLTRRQAEILNLAIESGYYETPRKVTLEQLARKAGVVKSTLSEVLRAAENKLVKYKG
ncbi:MAG: helix-turn-helix domain-containing protein [Candidatus Hadarchaeota archaeon]